MAKRKQISKHTSAVPDSPPHPFLKLTQAPWGLPYPALSLLSWHQEDGGQGPGLGSGGGEGRWEKPTGLTCRPQPCLGLRLVGENKFEAEQG